MCFQPSKVKVTSGLNEKIVDIDNYLIVLIDSKLCSPILVLTLYKGGSLFEIRDKRDSRSLRIVNYDYVYVDHLLIIEIVVIW